MSEVRDSIATILEKVTVAEKCERAVCLRVEPLIDLDFVIWEWTAKLAKEREGAETRVKMIARIRKPERALRST